MTIVGEGATARLAQWATDTMYADMPPDAIRLGRERIIDMIGVSLAGAADPDSAGIRAIEMVREMGGRGASTILGGGFTTNSVDAAFANGASAAALDVCDTTTAPLCHLSSCLVPAILAVAEEVGATGEQLIEAFVIAYESAVRVGACMSGDHYFVRGFHSCGSWACFGTTAGAAKLLGLSSDELRHAWGIVASAAGSLRTAYGTMTKPLHSAYSARNGVLAAKLAQKGMTGNMNVLDRDETARPTAHRYFSFPIIFDSVEGVDLSKVTEGLGEYWHLVSHQPTEKYHPGVAGTYIDLAIDMREKHGIDPAEVESVEFWTSPANLDCHGQFDDPQESDAARYSIRYAIAAAIIDGEVDIHQHTLDRIARGDIQKMMARLKANEIPEAHMEIYKLGDISDIYADAKLKFHMTDGREFEASRNRARGDWRLPLDMDEFWTKYRTCAREVLSQDQTETSIETLKKLEEQDDLTGLMALLAGAAA